MRKSLFVALLFVFAALVVPITSSVAQSNPCDDNYYYADTQVAWCVLPDWTAWAAEFGTTSDLTTMLSEVYTDITIDDLGGIGNKPRIAVQVHAPFDNFIVVAQLFVDEYDTDYSTPTALIQDSWIQYRDIQYDYQLDDAFGVPVGIVFVEVPEDGFSRGWIMYPFEDIGLTYTMSIFAPTGAWEDEQMVSELNNIVYSLFITDEPYVADAREQESTQSGEYPVWIGGEILSIESSRGKGSPQTAFDNALWEFFSDSTVKFTPDDIGEDVREDLFPVMGSYSVNGANIGFENGRYSIEGGTINFTFEYSNATASVLILGELDVDSGIATIRYLVQSSNIDSVNNIAGTNAYEVHFTQQLIVP